MLTIWEKSYRNGDFIGFFGALRSGKTLGAVRLANLLSRRHNLPIVSNIPVVGMAERISTLEQVQSLRNVVFVWDEVQASLDSREFAQAASVTLTRDLIMWGKRGIILLYTSPAFKTVDVRLRRLTRHCYITTARLTNKSGTYVLYEYWRHLYGDDVLNRLSGYAVRINDWYGSYDTLFGRDPGESLVIYAERERKK
jgi:hypothetical protein